MLGKNPKIKILKIEEFADAKNSRFVFCFFFVDDFLRKGRGRFRVYTCVLSLGESGSHAIILYSYSQP